MQILVIFNIQRQNTPIICTDISRQKSKRVNKYLRFMVKSVVVWDWSRRCWNWTFKVILSYWVNWNFIRKLLKIWWKRDIFTRYLLLSFWKKGKKMKIKRKKQEYLRKIRIMSKLFNINSMLLSIWFIPLLVCCISRRDSKWKKEIILQHTLDQREFCTLILLWPLKKMTSFRVSYK